MQRVIEIVLILIIAIGGAFLLPILMKLYGLQRELDHLTQKTGCLTITDPTKVHIRAIDTGEPLHFAWQAYFPANYSFSYTTNSGSGSNSHGLPRETILRVRIREVDGRLMIYQRLGGGGGGAIGGSAKLIELLKEHPDALQKLRVERLAADGLMVFDVGESHTLLKISLPPDLQAEAKEKFEKREYNRIVPTVEWIRFGPAAVAEQAKTKGILPQRAPNRGR
jgi:hypothetical protein